MAVIVISLDFSSAKYNDRNKLSSVKKFHSVPYGSGTRSADANCTGVPMDTRV